MKNALGMKTLEGDPEALIRALMMNFDAHTCVYVLLVMYYPTVLQRCSKHVSMRVQARVRAV